MNKRQKKATVLIILIAFLLCICFIYYIGHSSFDHSTEVGGGDITDLIPVEKHASLQMLQPGRSEHFPVVSYESSPHWQVIHWADEEIFVLSVNDVESARDAFNRSVDEYWQFESSTLGHIAQCGKFILIYRGDSSDILQWLTSVADSYR